MTPSLSPLSSRIILALMGWGVMIGATLYALTLSADILHTPLPITLGLGLMYLLPALFGDRHTRSRALVRRSLMLLPALPVALALLAIDWGDNSVPASVIPTIPAVAFYVFQGVWGVRHLHNWLMPRIDNKALCDYISTTLAFQAHKANQTPFDVRYSLINGTDACTLSNPPGNPWTKEQMDIVDRLLVSLHHAMTGRSWPEKWIDSLIGSEPIDDLQYEMAIARDPKAFLVPVRPLTAHQLISLHHSQAPS